MPDRLQELLVTPESPELGPGPRPHVRPVTELEGELKSPLGDIQLSATARDLIRALVLLWHDHLDAAHTISQGLETADGSLVHAIMHRREPDYGNAKYWWRRVGEHPCFPELGKRVTALLESQNERELCATLVPRGRWDAFAFVDACEAAGNRGTSAKRVQMLRDIQRLETNVALEYFCRAQIL
jgi:hypothetical protein